MEGFVGVFAHNSTAVMMVSGIMEFKTHTC
jgi:hypothetical protein